MVGSIVVSQIMADLFLQPKHFMREPYECILPCDETLPAIELVKLRVVYQLLDMAMGQY